MHVRAVKSIVEDLWIIQDSSKGYSDIEPKIVNELEHLSLFHMKEMLIQLLG